MITIVQAGVYTAKLAGIYNRNNPIYYARERAVLSITLDTAATTIKVNNISYYTTGTTLELDLSDAMRLSIGSSFALTITVGNTTYNAATISVVDGISPIRLIMPPVPSFFGSMVPKDHTEIFPPTVIYTSPRFASGADLTAEMRIAADLGTIGATGATISGAQLQYKNNSSRIVLNNIVGAITLPIAYYNLTPLHQCDDCVLLVWQSLTGVEKRAIWRVKKRTWANDGSQQYMANGDGYVVRKDAAESFTAYIEGCSRYDFAYYSDIVCSPKVQAICGVLDYTEMQIDTELVAVDVSTKSLEIPSEDGKMYEIAININYRHYDGKL